MFSRFVFIALTGFALASCSQEKKSNVAAEIKASIDVQTMAEPISPKKSMACSWSNWVMPTVGDLC